VTHIRNTIAKGNLVPLVFGQTDLAVSQTDVQLVTAIGESAQANDGYTLPWAFDVVGISYQLTAAVTAGAGGIGATINGTEDTDTTLAFLADSTTVKGYLRVPRGKASGVAGDVLGVELTTNGSFAPITTDLVVTVWVLAYIEGV
jgi:hypothetical protein